MEISLGKLLCGRNCAGNSRQASHCTHGLSILSEKTHENINSQKQILGCNLWYGENKQGVGIKNEDRSSLG